MEKAGYMEGWSQLDWLLYELVSDYEQGYGFDPELVKSLLESGRGDKVCGTLSLLRGADREGWIIPPVLFDPEARKCVELVEEVLGWNSTESLRLYQEAVNQQFRDPLTEIAQGRMLTAVETQMLAETLKVDDVQCAILDIPPGLTAEDVVSERVAIMQNVWPGFSQWWMEYFKTVKIEEVSTDTLFRVYIPLAQWIVQQKRSLRPDGLLVVGVYGGQGRGKTVLSRALVPIIDTLLADNEGRALARAIDDYYLGHAEREELRKLGYEAGEGVSNRGPAGTHDTSWILQNIQEIEASIPSSRIATGNFDKSIDDQPSNPHWVESKIGIFFLDGWFVGCNTDFNLNKILDPFRRRVAKCLQGEYREIFERFDVLLALDTPSPERIKQNREKQEQLLERQIGHRGMNPEKVERFVEYFYTKIWEPGVTSPIPPNGNVTFHLTMDDSFHFVQIKRGGRPIL